MAKKGDTVLKDSVTFSADCFVLLSIVVSEGALKPENSPLDLRRYLPCPIVRFNLNTSQFRETRFGEFLQSIAVLTVQKAKQRKNRLANFVSLCEPFRGDKT